MFSRGFARAFISPGLYPRFYRPFGVIPLFLHPSGLFLSVFTWAFGLVCLAAGPGPRFYTLRGIFALFTPSASRASSLTPASTESFSSESSMDAPGTRSPRSARTLAAIASASLCLRSSRRSRSLVSIQQERVLHRADVHLAKKSNAIGAERALAANHGKSSSVFPVNGQKPIQPAVPTMAPTIVSSSNANGAPSQGDHSRKYSAWKPRERHTRRFVQKWRQMMCQW